MMQDDYRAQCLRMYGVAPAFVSLGMLLLAHAVGYGLGDTLDLLHSLELDDNV